MESELNMALCEQSLFQLLQEGGEEREILRKSCRFFEAVAVQISALLALVLCCQTGFNLQLTHYFCR